jgi:nucleoside 2-deoxyribosyltransferase
MIVVVEGIDRVGKTTLVNKLVDAGFVNLKDEFVLNKTFISNFPDYSLGKCDSFVALARKLQSEGKNIVIDRLHITEIVYGLTVRGEANLKGCFAIDMELANMNAILCLVNPSNLELSNELAGEDQSTRNGLFGHYVGMSSMRKIICDYTFLDEVANYIIVETFKYDFYFASPFFNPEQVEREERMIAHLRKIGYKVFSPKESCHLDAKASQSSREDVFSSNCKAINQSRAVFAVTDGKDMGTIWEAGYAFGINKPIIYFAETLGDRQFNLMLAQSGRDVFTSQDEVTYETLSSVLKGNRRKFRGDIE